MATATAQDEAEIEKAKAEKFIAETPMIDMVESARVELGRDHSGDEAMWLVFRLRPGVEFGLDFINAGRFNDYAATIQTKILHSGLKRFPYTRVE
jgi:hypothetical protein